MTDLLDRLRDLDPAKYTGDWTATEAAEEIRVRVAGSRRPRRHWVAALVAAAAVLALVVTVAVAVVATSGDSSTKPVSDLERLVHGRWRKLSDSPFGAVGRAQMFSTSKGVLVWAEYSDSGTPPGFHGALYDLAAKKWTKLADPPVVLTTELDVWTGRDLVFPGAALAYDLRANRWRSITAVPIAVDEQTRAVWTGREIVVVASDCSPQSVALVCDRFAAVRFDPTADTWSPLAGWPLGVDAPVVGWSGDEVVVWGQRPRDVHRSYASMAYDPSHPEVGGNGWKLLPATPSTGQAVVASITRVGGSAVWAGWGYEPGGEGELRVARLEGGVWRSLAPLAHPSICAARSFTGPARSAIVWCSTSEQLRALDVAGNRWFDLPRQRVGIRTVVWTGGGLYALTADGGLLALH